MSNALDLLNQLRISAGNTSKASAPNMRPGALLWARVSTEKQEERGLSIPEQFRELRRFAVSKGIDNIGEYHEAASAFQHQSRRFEFHKMLARAQTDPNVSIILVHDLSRFGRDSNVVRTQIEELRRANVRVISLNDPEIDPETVAGVYMNAITFAKNEAYSREVAFHTRKGCRSNVQMRDPETGWCYKNGGQPLFGYRSERLNRGELKRGRPLVKIIWMLDETTVAGRQMHEWARYLLVELAARGASLSELRDFCNRTGIPGRRKQFWGLSTWNALLQPSVLLQYCGYGVWNVRDKRGRERPESEWIIVEKAHPALITETEARRIAEARKIHCEANKFDSVPHRSRSSNYLLSGGLFTCGRCGANMTGFRTDKGYYYVCGSQPYRRGMGCGPGVYVPQGRVEDEVIEGLEVLLSACANPKRFVKQVNEQLELIWASRAAVDSEAAQRIRTIDSKIANIRKAIEDGLTDANWANLRLRELLADKRTSEEHALAGKAPQLDVATALAFRTDTKKLLEHGEPTERKRLLRTLVESVKLMPEKLEVEIAYRVPNWVMNSVVAGDGFEPPTFGL